MTEQTNNQTYQIGHTAPPRSRKGLIAVLLAVIILLGGAISILGMMNISLFRQLGNMARNDGALAVVEPNYISGQSAMSVTHAPEQTVVLETSPQSIENITQEGGLSLQAIYERTVASLVRIETPRQSGTGVILTADGYILTNSYLLQNDKNISVVLDDGTMIPATVVGKDGFSDLAVLRVDANNLKPASFGDSSVIRQGDAVVAIGQLDDTFAMSEGIISAITPDLKAGGSSVTLFRTSAVLQNTGGPLVNCYGQIIGMHTHCFKNVMSESAAEDFCYSLDAVTVKKVADELIYQGFVSGRIHLGIRGHEIDSFYENYYDIPQGIFITHLDEDSELYIRGVREGDILLNLADTPILSFDMLHDLLSSLEDGQEVIAEVYRDGTRYHLTVTIGEK